MRHASEPTRVIGPSNASTGIEEGNQGGSLIDRAARVESGVFALAQRKTQGENEDPHDSKMMPELCPPTLCDLLGWICLAAIRGLSSPCYPLN